MNTPLRWLVPIGLVVLLTVPLAACGKDDPAPAPATSAASASPTASPTVTGPAAPALPEAVKVNDEAGAKAFVTYYFAALTYAMKVGDTDIAEKYAADDCEACDGITAKVRKIYEAGGTNEGGGWLVERLEEVSGSTRDLRRFIVFVVQPPQRLISADGTVVGEQTEQKYSFNVWASYGQNRWSLREIQEVSKVQ